MRVGEIGVDLERLLGRGGGRRRILSGERARDAEVRRGPVGGQREGLLKRLQRFGLIVGLERHFAPRGLHRRIGAPPDRAEQGFDVPHAAQRVRRARGAEQRFAVRSLETPRQERG